MDHDSVATATIICSCRGCLGDLRDSQGQRSARVSSQPMVPECVCVLSEVASGKPGYCFPACCK